MPSRVIREIALKSAPWAGSIIGFTEGASHTYKRVLELQVRPQLDSSQPRGGTNLVFQST